MTAARAPPASPLPDAESYETGREVVTLAEALDRLLHTGVSVDGRVMIGLAEVELLYLDLRLLLGSVDTIWPDGRPPFRPIMPPAPTPASRSPPGPSPPPRLSAAARPPAPREARSAPAPAPAHIHQQSAETPTPFVVSPQGYAAEASAKPTAPAEGGLARALSAPAPPSSSSTADGLVRLVLTVVKLLHDVLERQAVRRMSAGHLTDRQIENIGEALFAQAVELDKLRRQFGFSDGDLSLDLGRQCDVI